MMQKCDKDIIIVGDTSFAALLKKFIDKYADYSVQAFTVESKFRTSANLDGIEVIDLENIESRFPPSQFDMIIAVGYRQMNKIRKRLYDIVKGKGYFLKNFIHPSALVDADFIGEGNIILENVTVSVNTKIGNCNLIWDNVAIRHDSTIGNFNQISGHSSVNGFVTVGDNCFLGSNCTIEPECKIADLTLIGAGAHIKGNTTEYGVYVPAKTVKLDKLSTDFF